MAQAGLSRVSVSLDSLDEERFFEMNGHRGKVLPVLEGIEKAAEAGLQVKINMVVQKGKNDQDIVTMAQFFKEKQHILRFIEYMDVGNSNGWRLDDVVSKKISLSISISFLHYSQWLQITGGSGNALSISRCTR